jgi:DNA-damage-inducible protein J
MSNVMAQNATYQLRIDQQTKDASFAVFRELGMTPAEGMRIFLTKVAKTRAIPFPVNIPNATTAKALADADGGVGLNRAKNMDDLFKQLDI